MSDKFARDNNITILLTRLLLLPALIITLACSIKLSQTGAVEKELLWDMNMLKQAPSFNWVKKDSTVLSLTYQGVVYDGKPTQVFAYYSNPDIISGKPSSGKKFPGVVLIHGGGGRAFPQWVAKWARMGYAAIAMDLSGNDGTGKRLPDGGPEQSNENKIFNFSSADIKKTWPYYAVASVIQAHSLLLNFPEVEKEKTVVTGISWGGYLTCMMAGLDNRFKAGVPVYGCGFLGESDIFKKQLERLNAADRAIWLTYYDPANYMSVSKMPLMFLNGNKDKHYNVIPYDRNYRLIPPAQRFVCIKPDMKHNHPAGWESPEIATFFEQVLTKKKLLPYIVSASADANAIAVQYESPSPLLSAVLYYSNDTISLNENRSWSFQNATIDPAAKKITTTIPPEGYQYAFIQLINKDSLSMSTEYFIKSSVK